ncbi:mesencephalic astrocyte-derived neurotrophic factor homolog [Styela clava]|uniref:mesencephalic astrocyte-derived neurotrophic factor homolog n=1 Tax=Styela clava TaxID=7725 RepID=UPI00193985B8|nr:mesencephalic astrocyte-derived neurotrophic factor homolog [Styela clava]
MENKIVFLACCVVSSLILNVQAALKEGDCEVCIKVIELFEKELKENKIEGDENIQAHIRKICSSLKLKENRFCYYIGGTADAATSILKTISGPLGSFYPPKKICETLKKADSQICELKYDKPLDWKNINLKKMRVKELKKILSGWDENCEGCLEKTDFVKRIEELKPKYVREEL